MKPCPFCAEEIQDAAIKCKHCGSMLSGDAAPGALAAAASPIAPAPARAQVLYDGSPSWKAFFWQYCFAAILSLVVVGLIWLLVLHLTRRGLHYKITSASIDVESGVFSRTIETLQLWRVRDIDFHQSFWHRILGVATIHIFTKDVTDPELRIVGLPGSRDLFDNLKTAIEEARKSRNLMGIVE